MTQVTGLADLKTVLLGNPTKETLIEIINQAQLTNPVIKAMVFMAVNSLPQAEVNKFARVAVAAIQYIEAGDMEGLHSLCKRTGIPEQIILVIDGYARNYTKQ